MMGEDLERARMESVEVVEHVYNRCRSQTPALRDWVSPARNLLTYPGVSVAATYTPQLLAAMIQPLAHHDLVPAG